MSSKIQWTEHTWNPVVGCTPVSPGCLNCYAATQSRRLAGYGTPNYQGLTVNETDSNGAVRAVFSGKVRCVEEQLDKPLKRKKPTTYFIASMSDLFHESVPFQFIDRVFAVMALCTQHTFQVLTKRPERMAEYLSARAPGEWLYHYPRGHSKEGLGFTIKTTLPNVWLGTSAENQQQLEQRAKHLAKCSAVVRFLSCEPLLGPLNLGELNASEFPIHWIIAGGESGPNARPCEAEWIRSLIVQCGGRRPIFVKQLGSRPVFESSEDVGKMTSKGGDPNEWPQDMRVRQLPERPCVVSA